MNQIEQLVQRRQEAKNSLPLGHYQNEIAALARDEKMPDKRADKLLDTVEELAAVFPFADFKPANIAADAKAIAAYDSLVAQLDGADARYDAAQQTRIETSGGIRRLEEQLSALKSKRAIADHELVASRVCETPSIGLAGITLAPFGTRMK